ncbi:MAG: T9SS type A sorting domain-containing protein [Rubricoccaceae bacterium]|nr:T9SS type A sorting domain-containing protein [Rubricoccaceae bacterium]
MRKYLLLFALPLLVVGLLAAPQAEAQSLQTTTIVDATEVSSPASGLVVLYDQTANPGSNGAPSQFFPDFGGGGFAADDFVVPAGQTWDISQVFALGSYNGANLAKEWEVYIYADDAGLPGSEVFSETAITASMEVDGDPTLDLTTPATLGEGTYWLSIVAVLSFNGSDQWFQTVQSVQNGGPYHWQDPLDLFGTGCTTWMPGASVCGVGGGVDPDVSFTILGEMVTANEAGSELPTSVTLGQSYPNPFNPSATIPFEVDETSDVRIAVYDVLGREVATVVNQTYTPGSYTVSFDAIGLPSGTYMYRLEANGGVQMRTMSLLK